MIVLAAVLAMIVLIALIPLRIYADYHGELRLWGRVLFWKIDIYPRKAKPKPAPPAERPPKPAAESTPPPKKTATENSPKKVPDKEPEKPKQKFDDKQKQKPKEKQKPNREQETAGESLTDRISRYLKLADEFLGPLRRAMRRLIKIENISADVTVGLDDAANTAVCVGALWGVGYNLISLTDRIFKIEKHRLNITPNYDKAAFNAEGSCILRTNIANIISAAAILGIAFLRYKLKKQEE